MSLILATVSRLLLPVLALYSLHLMLRGHNAPGGGFIAGLLTAAALLLQYVANSTAHVKQRLPLNYTVLIAVGLLLAGGTGAAALVYGSAFLEHRMAHVHLPLLGEVELATALGFDLGVYLVVVGMTLLMVSTLAEQKKEAGR
jgi:multicomponent K+:H+ antiporter subunit A